MQSAVILLHYTTCGNTISINFPNSLIESETSKLRTVNVDENPRVIPKLIIFFIDTTIISLSSYSFNDNIATNQWIS
jgi:hypothetical protein